MERNWSRLAEEDTWEGTDRSLAAYGVPLSQVTSFKYMGRVFAEEENDWPTVVCNLRHARQKFTRMTWVLIREGEYARTLGQIYLAVVKLVLLYRSETWVLNPPVQRLLGGFHYSVDRIMTGRQPRKGQDRGWVYFPLEDVMEEAELQKVENYVC